MKLLSKNNKKLYQNFNKLKIQINKKILKNNWLIKKRKLTKK